MRPSRALLASLLLLAPAPGEAQRPDLAALDRYVATAVRDWGVPGLAIAVVKDGAVVFAKGYGVRRLGSPEPVDEHTLFAIGSTTKAMTTLSLLMLRDEEKVQLEEPVLRHLPTLQLYDPVMTRELTVVDLLTHYTGLPGSDQLWTGSDYDTAEIIRRMRFLRPVASFRNRYAYQNVQYAMAGEVVRVTSGMSWEEFVQARIFAPLGMSETVATLAGTTSRPNVASPHGTVDDTLRVIANRSVDPVAAAGSVWSSVHDMAKWMNFVLDSGRVGGRRLVRAEGFTDWLTPRIVVPRADFYPTTRFSRPHFIGYALGWFIQDYAGDAVAMHTGSIDGMSAIIGLVPDRRLGVYVLANADHAELRHALMFRVFDMYAGRPARDWSGELRALYGEIEERGRAAQKAFTDARVAGTSPALPLARYAGSFADSLNGTVRVSVEGSSLRVTRGKGFTGVLEHWHYDTFLARWDDSRRSASPITFSIGPDGAVSAIEVGRTRFGRVRERNTP